MYYICKYTIEAQIFEKNAINDDFKVFDMQPALLIYATQGNIHICVCIMYIRFTLNAVRGFVHLFEFALNLSTSNSFPQSLFVPIN